MPAANPVVINDGATTPVAFTYSPLGKDEKGVLWFEQTIPVPTTPLEACKIGYRQTRTMATSQTNGTSKATFMLMKPKAETLGNSSTGITPPPTLAYKLVARVEIDLPERSTKQERKDTRAFLVNLLSNSLVVSTIDDLQPIYGV